MGVLVRRNHKMAKEGGVRSKELADFAGVTVRALRHYHQMGLLPEPPRSANGYRSYSAGDIVRVLRIKRMTSLGMSLQQVGEMLEGEGADEDLSFTEALDALDAELTQEIERLQEKRRVLAMLRERNLDPDVPLAFGDHVARLRDAGASQHLVEMERSGLLLVDRFFASGSEEAEAVSRFFSLIAETDSVETYVSLNERMLALSPASSEGEREKLVDEFVGFMLPILMEGKRLYGWELGVDSVLAMSSACDSGDFHAEGAGFSPSFPSSESQDLDTLMDMYDRETLNEAQVEVNDRVVKGLLAALGG